MLTTLMFLSNRKYMNLVLRIGVLSIAIAILSAPCAFAQGFKIGCHCIKEPKSAYSRTTWDANANARASKHVDTYSMRSLPKTPVTMPQNHTAPAVGWNGGHSRPASVDSGYPGPRRVIVDIGGPTVPPGDNWDFPSYTPAQTPYESPKPTWHEDLSNEEIRAKTIWAGANREDRKMQSEIVEKQLRDGAESPEAIELTWSRAQYFLAAQKPTLAEPLLKELIVTIESHKSTRENQKILALARSKLYKLQSIRENIENPTYAKRGSKFKFVCGTGVFGLNGRAGRSRP